jgi:hypothetical protein
MNCSFSPPSIQEYSSISPLIDAICVSASSPQNSLNSFDGPTGAPGCKGIDGGGGTPGPPGNPGAPGADGRGGLTCTQCILGGADYGPDSGAFLWDGYIYAQCCDNRAMVFSFTVKKILWIADYSTETDFVSTGAIYPEDIDLDLDPIDRINSSIGYPVNCKFNVSTIPSGLMTGATYIYLMRYYDYAFYCPIETTMAKFNANADDSTFVVESCMSSICPA